MLNIEALCKRFPGSERTLFEAVSLRVEPGECVAIMGESGVGKSTLLNCVAGLERCDGGRIMLDHTRLDVLDDDAFARVRRRSFGFVFQAFHILPHLDLRQNVSLPLWMLGIDGDAADARADAMLLRVGLGGRERDLPRRLSGGELQRVAIARALVHGPSLVLADEPTGNLDPERAAAVLELLLEQVRGEAAAGLLVTHSLAAARRCDRIVRLTHAGLIALPGADAAMEDGCE